MVCTICESNNTSIYKRGVTSVYSKKKYDIGHCLNCDHYFTYPMPDRTELDDIYSNKYSYDAHSLIEAEKRMRARNYAKYIASLPNVNSVLEVGCMHGILLSELKKLGMSVEGVELNPEAVQYCQSIGLSVTNSSVEEHLEKADGSHDVIVMSHVLEHISDPKKQLDGLRRRMSKNGQLVLIVPNSASGTRKLFGKYWGYWQVPVHINHFNTNSIKELLTNTGFKVSDVAKYGGDSLFFLSSLANLLGSSNDSKNLSPAKKALVKGATVVLRPWYHIGSEDLLVVASKA